MSGDEYEGPVYTVLRPGGEGFWQYALRQSNGECIELEGVPRLAARNLVRRWMVPASEWQEFHDVDL